MRFERAGALRDQLKAIQAIVERQKIVFPSDYLDSDVLAMARSDGEACVQIFFIRGGKLIGREYFVLEGTEDAADTEVMTQFVKQFYTEAATIPHQVMLPEEIEEARIISQWLRSRRGAEAWSSSSRARASLSNWSRWRPRTPPRRWPPCVRSGRPTRTSRSRRWQSCRLPWASHAPPNRIECYDVSNTQGTAIVGAMVVFERGVPSKSLYRRFNIETVVGAPDDFASMEEMLTRRFRRWAAAQENCAAAGPQAGSVLLRPAGSGHR